MNPCHQHQTGTDTPQTLCPSIFRPALLIIRPKVSFTRQVCHLANELPSTCKTERQTPKTLSSRYLRVAHTAIIVPTQCDDAIRVYPVKPDNLPLPEQTLRIFAEISHLQVELMEHIFIALQNLNLITPRLRLKNMRPIEDNLLLFRNQVIHLERIFEQPREFLQSYRDIEKVVKDPSEVARIEFDVLQRLRKGQLADRRIRIFTLLEHLESAISSKKSEVQFNRTILISSIALVVAFVATVISIISIAMP